MSKPIIEVKNLSKVYNIGHEQRSAPGTLTFRDSIVQTFRKPLEIFTGHRMEQEKFWALKDVNFEVNQGDVIGIVGRNGSGKSTLLKILSRIVEPTEGEITMRGRVASLLEVGTGFHPELTGRENVFFNGAILGMSQKEIKSKFDEIVAFSEVEKFLDTPVKFYSSGMYVRLAFAVAAHLDPDILIVDEVLAVGDAAFQKKCLGKMKDVAGQGRTVLFVSHSMGSVSQLCNKAILLSGGKIIASDTTEKIVDLYMQKSTNVSNPDKERTIKVLDGGLKLNKFSVNESALSNTPHISSGSELVFEMAYDVKDSAEGQDICVGLALKNQAYGVCVYYSHSHLEEVKHKLRKGKGKVNAVFQPPYFGPGSYSLELNVWLDGTHVVKEYELGDIQILPAPFFRSQSTFDTFPAVNLISTDWKFEKK